MKSKIGIFLIIIIVFIATIAYFSLFRNSTSTVQNSPIVTTGDVGGSGEQPIISETADNSIKISKNEVDNWKTYQNSQYGVEIKYPQSWYEYGDKSSFSNPDLLSWRGFVPDYDANKPMGQQALFSTMVFNKNADSSFDAPKRFITKTRTDEKWEPVNINGYSGTKITNTTTNKVTDYVFEHGGKLYNFYASQPNLFEILFTLKFL